MARESSVDEQAGSFVGAKEAATSGVRMNGCERILAALEGRRPDQVPILLHNFPMAARESGLTMRQYRTSAKAISDCLVDAMDRYGLDGVLLDVDTVALAAAAGVEIEDPEDEPSRCRRSRVGRIEEVDDLEPADILASPRVQVWLEAACRLKERCGDERCVRGNCDQSPFSLASMIRGPEAWMMDLLSREHRGHVIRLLEHCETIGRRFVEAMAATGVHVLSGGDSPAGPELISPEMYRVHARPGEERLVEAAHRQGKPWILHICGDTTPILEDMVSTGADGLELDHRTDVLRAREALRGRSTFVGNVDPSGVLALGSPEDVRTATRRLVSLFAEEPRWILNAGCALPATTPSENIRAMVAAAREAG